METTDPPIFLDVPALLESSEPRPRIPWFWYGAGGFGIMMFLSLFEKRSPQSQQAFEVLSGLILFSLMGLGAVALIYSVRQLKAAQQAVENVAELIQLRRWLQAAVLVNDVLSRPARSRQLQAQALAYLAAVLVRYHRFEDSIAVLNHLLESGFLDEQTTVGLRLSRAMAMLHEDHLFDADRAINDLRRSPAAGSAGLALVEIYRDVKTGHPDDAINTFEQKKTVIRDQLGHRMADAYGLCAKAFDLKDRTTEAAQAWQNATLLAPVTELLRRYPELEKLAARYAVASAPPELA
jgi:hypothetical protein